MTDKKSVGDDPFPQLPRRSFYGERPEIDAAKDFLRGAERVAAQQFAAGVLVDAEMGARKLGRPSLGKPWVALGMSRSVFFAHKKAGTLPNAPKS